MGLRRTCTYSDIGQRFGKNASSTMLELAKRHAAPVPRYTSYPTAAQFTERVGRDDAAAWLGALASGRALSLYAHIPFCASLCWYCACNMNVANRYEPVERYLALLLTEMANVAALVPAVVGTCGARPLGRRLAEHSQLLATFSGSPSARAISFLSRHGRVCSRDRSARARPRSASHSFQGRGRQPGLDRRAGFRSGGADGDQPAAVVRDDACGRRHAARSGHLRYQHRPCLRPAAPDARRRGADARAGTVARSRSRRDVRLRLPSRAHPPSAAHSAARPPRPCRPARPGQPRGARC